MKKLKLFFSVLMLLFMSVGQIWGEKITLTATSLELTGSYTSETEKTVGGVTFVFTDLMKNSSNIQAKASSGVLYNKTAIPGNITEIKVTHSGTARSTTVCYGTTAQPTTNSETFSGSKTISVSGSNTYFKVTRGSNAAYWTSVEITYTPAGSNNPTVSTSPTSLTFDAAEVGGSAPGAKSFTITGSNLTGNLTVASSNTTLYTCAVTSGSLTPSNKAVSATVTVTPQAAITTSAGTKEANITISGGGLTSNVDVALSTTVTTLAHTYQYTQDFSQISGFSSWGNSYSEHTVNYDILPATPDGNNDVQVYFASACKQGTTITNIPVTKGGNVELKLLNETKYLSAIKFVCQQWGTNSQTITLHYSTDGGTNYTTFNPSITSTNFEIENTSLPAKTNAVKISFSSSSKQVGISSVSFDLVDKVSYNINKSETGCTLSVTNGTSAITTAEAGDEVYVSIASTTTGYENASFVVKDADNNSVTVSNGKFTMPAKAVTITATATKKQYTVTLSATNGKIQVGGVDKTSISVAHGETAELTAVANNDYAFSSWATSDGTKVSLSSTTNNPATITVTGAATITATFVSTAKLNPGFAWSAASAEAVKGQAASLPTITTNPYSLTPTYVSTNTDVAEISSAGVVSIKGVGSTTIKATYAEDATYSAYEASYTLTVKGRVTWHVIKEGVDATSSEDYEKDAVPTKPTPSSCDASISLVGWTTSTYAKSNTAPATLYTGNVPAVTDNADYYAVWANVSEDEWVEIESAPTAGTYAICTDTYFMKASITSNRFENGEATPAISNGKLTEAPAADCQWILSINGEGKYLIQNGDNYAGGTSAKNQGTLLEDPTDSHAQWNISYSNGIVAQNIGRSNDSNDSGNAYIRNNGNSGWGTYASSYGSAPRFFKLNAGAISNYTTNCVPPLTVAAPTFSPDGSAAYYTSEQTVTILCTTDGATIYYSLDGSEPSIEYESAITISETKTLKAKAVLSEVSSEITEATFTINLPLTTIEDVYNKAVAINSTTTQKVIIDFDNWVVSGIGSDNKSVYITDGTKGFVIYGSSHGFVKGDILSGSVECDLCLFNGFAEVKDLKANNTSLTVTTGGTVTPQEVTISGLGGVNVGAPIILNNLKYNGTNLVDGGENVIAPNNTLWEEESAYALTTNKYYNVTGLYVHTTTAKKIAPRVVSDIELLASEAPTMTWYVSSATEVEIGTTYKINEDEVFAPVCEVNSGGTLSYSSTVSSVAEIDENTGELTINGVGTTVIRCSVTANGEYLASYKEFTLTVKPEGSGEASWVATTWASDNGITSTTTLTNYATIVVDDNVSMTWAKTASNATFPAYHKDGEGRLYTNTSLQLTSTNSRIITKVTFVFTGTNIGTISVSDGTYNATNKEWTGFSNDVTFTNTGSAAYIKSINIEYTNGTTTTLSIDNIVMMDNDAAATIAFTCNKPNPTIVYSDYDDNVISIADGKITPIGRGSTTVKASIAADAPYSSVVVTFSVRVKDHNSVEDQVVIYAEYDGHFYALSSAIEAVEVQLCGGKMIVADEETMNAIVWSRTASEDATTFYNASINKYLTANSDNLAMDASSVDWTWNEAGYYTKVSGRAIMYRRNGTQNVYKNYSTSNVGSAGYVVPEIYTGEVVVGEITNVREGVSSGRYGTICWRYGGTMLNGMLMEIAYYDASKAKIFFDEIVNGEMVAGRPYLFMPYEGVETLKIAQSGNEESTAGSWRGLVGSYSQEIIDQDGNNYILYSNQFYVVNSQAYVGENRAYIALNQVDGYPSAPAPGRRRIAMNMNSEQVATGIFETELGEQPMKVVIDDQLFILRAGKLYDMTGNVVK